MATKKPCDMRDDDRVGNQLAFWLWCINCKSGATRIWEEILQSIGVYGSCDKDWLAAMLEALWLVLDVPNQLSGDKYEFINTMTATFTDRYLCEDC